MKYDPYSRQMAENPYPVYRWLRENDPVHHIEELGIWALTRYEDVLEAHLDFETFSSSGGTTIERLDRGFTTLITTDPPEHTSARMVVRSRFGPLRVAELDTRIREVSAQLLDDALGSDDFDLVKDFSARLPMVVIAELMGLPDSERDRIHDLANRMLARDEESGAKEVPESAALAAIELFVFFKELAAERRANPGDDVCSLIAHTPVNDTAGAPYLLDDEQLAGRYIELAIAGHETVMKLVANGAVHLETEPDQRRQLASDPTLIPLAVEEMLRLDPPSQYQGRTTTREVHLHGKVIPAGAFVLLVTGSATRDERVYTDPDRFDFRREMGRQVAFGYGRHLCLGATLARLEAKIAFEELLGRYPDYVVHHDRAVRAYSSNIRGLKSLPVSFRQPVSA